jgi:hypothetical protein
MISYLTPAPLTALNTLRKEWRNCGENSSEDQKKASDDNARYAFKVLACSALFAAALLVPSVRNTARSFVPSIDFSKFANRDFSQVLNANFAKKAGIVFASCVASSKATHDKVAGFATAASGLASTYVTTPISKRYSGFITWFTNAPKA